MSTETHEPAPSREPHHHPVFDGCEAAADDARKAVEPLRVYVASSGVPRHQLHLFLQCAEALMGIPRRVTALNVELMREPSKMVRTAGREALRLANEEVCDSMDYIRAQAFSAGIANHQDFREIMERWRAVLASEARSTCRAIAREIWEVRQGCADPDRIDRLERTLSTNLSRIVTAGMGSRSFVNRTLSIARTGDGGAPSGGVAS